MSKQRERKPENEAPHYPPLHHIYYKEKYYVICMAVAIPLYIAFWWFGLKSIGFF